MAESLIFHYRDADNFLVRLNPNAKLCALLSFSIVVSSAEPYLVFLLSIGIVAALVFMRQDGAVQERPAGPKPITPALKVRFQKTSHNI